MQRKTRGLLALGLGAALVVGGAVAMFGGPSEPSAPESPELEADAVPEGATTFEVVPDSSEIGFAMDAELEKITGKAPKSVSGKLHVDLSDIFKTTGLVKVDLMQLSIFQRKRESASGEFGEETKNEKQNEHMRTWLQISEDAPPDVREQNRYAELKVLQVSNATKTDITQMQGAGRRVAADVTGELRLHGQTTLHTLAVEIVFHYREGKVVSLQMRTLQPLKVALDAHDVKPRKAFDQLADATLETLGAKVAKVAMVDVRFQAKVP